jgi:hypothetical protein
MLIRPMSVPADDDRWGTNQMRQRVCTGEHFRRGNAARRNGYVVPLIQAVEDAAVVTGVQTLWLHTESAERIYKSAGREKVETVKREGKKPATLMRRVADGTLTVLTARSNIKLPYSR